MVNYKEIGTILKVENVNLKFGDVTVLRDINLEVQDITRENLKQGQVNCLIGRSGVGKTQLFKILAGLNKPTSGQVKIGLEQSLVKAGSVGIIPQNYLLFNHRTIKKNLLIAVSNSNEKNSDKEKLERVNFYAEEFNLTEHLDKFPQQLSGGQRQRVSIAQQLLVGNKFILMDEPTSGLDPIMKEKVLQLIIKISLMDELNTIIIVSHDISSALAISDLAWILAKEKDKEGATITKVIDLKKMGLAWKEDIKRDSKFIELVEDVKNII